MYLSRTDTAARLGIHPNTLDSWARTGRINRFRIPGSRAALYHQEEVDTLVKNDTPHLTVLNAFERLHLRRYELDQIIYQLIAAVPAAADKAIAQVVNARHTVTEANPDGDRCPTCDSPTRAGELSGRRGVHTPAGAQWCTDVWHDA